MWSIVVLPLKYAVHAFRAPLHIKLPRAFACAVTVLITVSARTTATKLAREQGPVPRHLVRDLFPLRMRSAPQTFERDADADADADAESERI